MGSLHLRMFGKATSQLISISEIEPIAFKVTGVKKGAGQNIISLLLGQ